MSSPSRRPVSIWLGPMTVAGRWGELGADPRELAQLWYSIMDQPDRRVEPFLLSPIWLEDRNASDGKEVIQERLGGRIWRELLVKERKEAQFLNREFMAKDSVGKGRSCADMSHFSNQYNPIVRKS